MIALMTPLLAKALLALFALCVLGLGVLILVLLGGRHVRTLNKFGRNKPQRQDPWGLNLPETRRSSPEPDETPPEGP